MKKVARMRLSPNNLSEEFRYSQHSSSSEPIVRTTGRIKKPKAVFDPSDNYLPRAQRSLINSAASYHASTSFERRASYTKASTVSPVGPSESKDACVVCRKKESKRPAFASKNPLITCQGCQRKIHKLCLKVDFYDFETVQRNYMCYRCTSCKICNDTFVDAEDEVITCSKCTKCFHLACFPTKIIKTDNQRNWKCNKCQVYQISNGSSLPVKTIREIIGSGEPSTSASSEKPTSKTENSSDDICKTDTKLNPSCALKRKRSSIEQHSSDVAKAETVNDKLTPPPEKCKKETNQSPDTSTETVSLNEPSKSDSAGLCYTPNENFDDLPDVKEWSVDQVHDYFYKHFPKEACVFKNEEIDGRSLLLLKRSDIVKKLPLKLGPSLRIYSLILKIQAQLNDPTLGWNCGL